ncbi:MAG: ankyrin repeat domain-containing protein [Candidatus Protochlamydia sp.]|nr:ankyrin repeat domain-containing protein [Candidatus Protochlamydia sp.]
MDINQPFQRFQEDKWNEIINLQEEELRKVLSNKQKNHCGRLIKELVERIRPEYKLKPLHETVLKIVHCLPDNAAEYSFSLATILNYMKTNNIFNVQAKGWLNSKAWWGETVPDPQLFEKIKINLERGDGKFALALLKNGFFVSNETLGEFLFIASSRGERDFVKFITKNIYGNIRNIEQSELISIKNSCEDALLEASLCGETDIVIKLIDFGNKINKFILEENEHFDISSRNVDGNTSLHLALLAGHSETAKELIKLSINLNTKNFEGRTPLHIASVKKNKELSLILILNRATINIEDKNGLRPNLDILTVELKESILTGVTEKALALIQSDVPTKNDFLFLACKFDNLKVAFQLIEKKDINLINFKDQKGNTPLHWACLHGNLEIATMLIQNGADFLIANNEGQTPMSCASFEQSFFVKHSIAYIKKLDINFGTKIEYELGRPSPLITSDAVKVLFALTALLKGLENTQCIDLEKFIKNDLIYQNLTPYYGSYEKGDYLKRLDTAVSKGLLTLADHIGGSEFKQDFASYYAPTLSKFKFVFDNPFPTASREEKMKMVFLAKAQKTCSSLISNNKYYSKNVIESAILRYMNACQAKNIPFILPTEESILPFCFEVVIENALSTLPTETKEAIIALFNTMKGKNVPLTKDGQKRLVFLATQVASPKFAQGRPPAHFRAFNKFPTILRAMHISDVNALNNFLNDELLGEMFDTLQSDIFRNINAGELLDAALDHPEAAVLSVLTPVITSLLGGEELNEETVGIIQKIAEGFSNALSNQMQILNREDLRSVTRALEFTITASSDMIFDGLIEGIESAQKAEIEKPNEEPSLTQQLIQEAATYLFNQPTGVLDGLGASFGMGMLKQFISRDRLVKVVISLVIQILNQTIPYIISNKVKEFENQIKNLKLIENKSLAENKSLQTLNLQYDIFKSLSNLSPQLTALVGKILTHLTNNIDLEQAHSLIIQWQNYTVEASIDEKVNKEDAKKEAKAYIVNMLYESIITIIEEVQYATPDLVDGVLSGIQEIFSQGLRVNAFEEDYQFPVSSLVEEKQREKLTLEQTQLTQKIKNDLEKELIRLSTPGRFMKATISEDEFKKIQQLLPEFEKEFEGLFLNNPLISDLVAFVRIGNALLNNGYTTSEIAIGCKNYWEAQLRNNLSLTAPTESNQIYPFIFDAVIEILADDAIHSGKTRLGETILLKEKLQFYLNHRTINSTETPLNEKGKAVLKAMIDTLLDPEFCKGLPLLHPLVLVRFPLILQGVKLSDVDRLNSKKSEFIRKIMISESEVCFKKINIGNIKNGMLNNLQEFMKIMADPLVNVLTPGLSSEKKRENEGVVHEMISAFILTSPIQNLFIYATKMLKDYNLRGIELDVEFSVEGFANEIKNTLGRFLSTLNLGKLPASETANSMVLTEALLAVAQQFSEAQSLRTELAEYRSQLKQAQESIVNLHWEISKHELIASDTKKTDGEREYAREKVAKLSEKLPSLKLKLKKLEDQINPLIEEKKKEIASNKIANELEEMSGIKATGISWGITFGKVLDPSKTKMLETILKWVKPWISPLILSPVVKIINESTVKRNKNTALIQDLSQHSKNKLKLVSFIQLNNLSRLAKDELDKLTPDELIDNAQKALGNLIKEDSDKLLIAETIKANESKIVNLLFDIISSNLPLLNNISKFIDLVSFIAHLSNNPQKNVDQKKLISLCVESITVILDNTLIFENLIPTILDSLRRVQTLDLTPQWLEEVSKNTEEKEGLSSSQVTEEKASFIEGNLPKGITNIGNSCYLNSTMQVLIEIPAFREKIMNAQWVGFIKFKNEVKEEALRKNYYKLSNELDYIDWDNLEDVDLENLGREDIKLNEEQQLFMQNKVNEYSVAKKVQFALQNFVLSLDASLRPEDMSDSAAKLRQAIYDTGLFERDRLNEEQDASALIELLMFWLGVENPFEITRTFSLVNEELIESHPVGILQVPIQPGMDAQNQLNDLFNTKNINDPENAITINGTLQSQWNETVRIGSEPPQQIVLQFKRFKNDGAKIRDPINLPRDHIIDLSTGFERSGTISQARYKVTGAIQHVGNSIAKGHYVAFILKNEQWYRTSDKDVTKVNATDIDQMLAYSYVLFLEKV